MAEGTPSEIVTEKLMEDVFGLASVIITDPVSGTPLVVPEERPRNLRDISIAGVAPSPSTILPPVA